MDGPGTEYETCNCRDRLPALYADPADYKIFGKTAFDLADFFVSNLGLPIGGIIACLLAAWFAWDKVHTHWTSLQNYPGWKKVLRVCIGILCPALVLAVLISGLMN